MRWGGSRKDEWEILSVGKLEDKDTSSVSLQKDGSLRGFVKETSEKPVGTHMSSRTKSLITWQESRLNAYRQMKSFPGWPRRVPEWACRPLYICASKDEFTRLWGIGELETQRGGVSRP